MAAVAVQFVVSMRAQFLNALGGEAGCKRLSEDFYGRVAKDPVLRPLSPGKSLRCPTEEFAAFLIQFLGGDEEQTQHRWWLSLRESHARFRIGPAERTAWLKNMGSALEAAPLADETRRALRDFFSHSSSYGIFSIIRGTRQADGKRALETQPERCNIFD